MALTREKKTEIIDRIKQHASNATALFAVRYKGVNTHQLTEIRASFHADQIATVMISKNTLSRIGLRETPFAECSERTTENIVYFFAHSEPPKVAQRLVDYSKELENFIPEFAQLENTLFDRQGFESIAKMPTREVALAQLLATMQAPISQLARTVNEIPTRFVRLLGAVAGSKF